MLQIRTLGGFSVVRDQATISLPSEASRLLLAYLATHPDTTHTRSHLIGLLWPDLSERAARRRLSHTLWEIGQALDGDDPTPLLWREADAVGVAPRANIHVDAQAFEAAWDESRQAASDASARSALPRAADFYTGEFMAGYYADWVVATQERLREIHLQILQRLATLHKGAGDFEAALTTVLAQIQADPLHETAYQEGIRLYMQLDRPQAARDLFDACARVLREELDVDPAPETAALLERTSTPATPAQPAIFSPQDLPLVGRARERQTLLRHLEETLGGQGGVVLVAGEAGVGKSRLLRALAEDAMWRGVTVLRGRAEDGGEDVPYAPLIAALGDGLSPLRAQQLATLLDPLWLSVTNLLLPQLKTWLPQVVALPPMQPEQERIRLLEGVVRLILALGQITPLLLLLEDLHWADESTFDALVYLAQRLPDHPVLLVASFRGGDAGERAHVQAGLRAVDRVGVRGRISLAPFSPEETSELIQQGLGLTEPAALFSARLHAETGGNPLFVLESLRTLHAEGLLVQDDVGNWTTPFDQATADYAELPLAHAVESTIARRLDRLDVPEQEALVCAAVVGGEIGLPLLMGVSGMPGRDLLAALGGLLRHNLLQETTTAYRFSHDKVRETVYAGIPAGRRRDLHRTIARHLAEDSAGASASAASIAHHFEAGEAWVQAAQFYAQAGRDAAALFVFPAALAHLDRAEELDSRDAASVLGRFHFLLDREEVLAKVGDRERQRTDLDELAELATDHPDRSVTVHERYGRLLGEVADYGQAEHHLQTALELARRQGNTTSEAAILAQRGQNLYWSGDLEAAIPVLDNAVAVAQRVHAHASEAEAQVTLSGIYYDLSRHDRATQAAERAVSLFRGLGNAVGEADVLSTLGAVAMEQGHLDEADAYFAQALPVIRSSGYRYAEARCLVNWGNIDFLRGRLGQALERFQQGLRIFEQTGSDRGRLFTVLNIAATLSTYVGPDAAVEEQVRRTLDSFAQQENTSSWAQALGILGQFARLRGDIPEALALCNKAIASLEHHPDPWVQAQTYQARAGVHLDNKDWAEARQDAEKGLALCAKFGFEDLSPLLMALKSRALVGLGHIDEAAATIDEAVAGREETDYAAHAIYLNRYQTMTAAGNVQAANAAIEKAHRILERILASLSPEDQARSRIQIPEHRAILAAWDAHRPVRQTVRLPRAEAPLGRPLTEDEEIAVTWDVEISADRTISVKTERRRQQILRLLRQAQKQGAVPAYHHLADALDVSERTIKRDMAALRAAGEVLPPTRGV